MARHPQLYPWTQELATRLPVLNPALAAVLALWTVGIVLARCCGLDSVTVQIASLLARPFDTVRQRLREFYQEASQKRGSHRKDFRVDGCFAPLLRWVTSFWSDKRVALALDVTNLGSRFHVLCISALYGGIGIPIAWKIVIGNQPDPWHPHWCSLLQALQGVLGSEWQVVVVSDRGLESSRLFREIVALGWHPLMRIKRAAAFRPKGWRHWYSGSELVPQRGGRFAMRGLAYKSEPLACTLLGIWDERHEDAWLLLTDLPPKAANPCWYAWRAWIEQGFKVSKSAGLDWQNSRMTNPERAERQFLAIAVTTLWLVAVGSEVEHAERIETLGRVPCEGEPPIEGEPQTRARRIRLFFQGAAAVIAGLINGPTMPHGVLHPQPFPKLEHAPEPAREYDYRKRRDLQL